MEEKLDDKFGLGFGDELVKQRKITKTKPKHYVANTGALGMSLKRKGRIEPGLSKLKFMDGK